MRQLLDEGTHEFWGALDPLDGRRELRLSDTGTSPSEATQSRRHSGAKPCCQTLKIGQVYSAGMPLFGERSFALRIPGKPTGFGGGSNRGVFNDEFLATEISQVGTQFDGLGHFGVQIGRDGDTTAMRFYNGLTAHEIVTAYGLASLGAEKLFPIVARGVLIDVAGSHGLDRIPAGDVVSALVDR